MLSAIWDFSRLFLPLRWYRKVHNYNITVGSADLVDKQMILQTELEILQKYYSLSWYSLGGCILHVTVSDSKYETGWVAKNKVIFA